MRNVPKFLLLMLTLPIGCAGSENAQFATMKNELKATRDERDAAKAALVKLQGTDDELKAKLKDAENKLNVANEKLAAIGGPKKADPPAGDQLTAGAVIVYRSGMPERLHLVEPARLRDLAAFFKKQEGGGGDDKRLDPQFINDSPRYLVCLRTTENKLLRIAVSKVEGQPWWGHDATQSIKDGFGGWMKGDFDKLVTGLGKGQSLDDRGEPAYAFVCTRRPNAQLYWVPNEKLKDLLSHFPGYERRTGGEGGGGAGDADRVIIVFRHGDPMVIRIEPSGAWYAGSEAPTKNNAMTNGDFGKFVESLRKSKDQ